MMTNTPPQPPQDPSPTTPEPPKGRAAGRKAIRLDLKPSDLMAEPLDLVGIWTAQIITLFPGAFPGVLGESLTGKALQEGLWQLRTFDLRDFGDGKHRKVDDTPAGGGAGLVLRPDIVANALRAARSQVRGRMPLVYLSPRGKRFDQAMARDWAAGDGVTLLCGRFEGVDQRVLEAFDIQEVSLGDFVLTGGEIAAQAMIDAAVRLRPGILGNDASTVEESHSNGLLEHPQYTKPSQWEGRNIPAVLMSGHHGNVEKWRQDQAESLTRTRRPDLWAAWCAKTGRDPHT